MKSILLQGMADAGASPAAVYAFHKTGIYVTDENVDTLPLDKLRAWDNAIEEYEKLASQTPPV